MLKLLPVLVLAGCSFGYFGDGKWRQTDPIAPFVRYDHDGPLQPGTPIAVDVSWEAQCTRGNHDFGEDKACERQPFEARVMCSGPCLVEPPSAGTGIALLGAGKVTVLTTGPGAVHIDVALTNTKTQQIHRSAHDVFVGEPDRIVIECAWNRDPVERDCFDVAPGTANAHRECPKGLWVPCEAIGNVERNGGNDFAIWARFQVGDVILPGKPEVKLEGLAPIPLDPARTTFLPVANGNEAAKHDGEVIGGHAIAPGTIRIRASAGALRRYSLTAERVIELR